MDKKMLRIEIKGALKDINYVIIQNIKEGKKFKYENFDEETFQHLIKYCIMFEEYEIAKTIKTKMNHYYN